MPTHEPVDSYMALLARNPIYFDTFQQNTDEKLEAFITRDPHFIRFFPEKYLTREHMKLAVSKDGTTLKYLQEFATEEIMDLAIEENYLAMEFAKGSYYFLMRHLSKRGWLLQFIKNPTYNMKLTAVYSHGYALKYIKKQKEELCLAAVKNCGCAVKYSLSRDPTILNMAIINDPFALEFIPEQTEDMALFCVRKNPLTLKYVTKKTLAICIEAMNIDESVIKYTGEFERFFLSQKPLLVEFSENKSLIFFVINKYPFLIRCVENQTSEMHELVLRKNILTFEYLKNPSVEFCISVVKRDGLLLRFIQNQTVDICLEAITQNPRANIYVNDELVTHPCLAAYTKRIY
jgi:hypothetical protein